MKLKKLIQAIETGGFSPTFRRILSHAMGVTDLKVLVSEREREDRRQLAWTLGFLIAGLLLLWTASLFGSFAETKPGSLERVGLGFTGVLGVVGLLTFLFRIASDKDPNRGRLGTLRKRLDNAAEWMSELFERSEEAAEDRMIRLSGNDLASFARAILVFNARSLLQLEADNKGVPRIMWENEAINIKRQFETRRRTLIELGLLEDKPYGPIFDEARRHLAT